MKDGGGDGDSGLLRVAVDLGASRLDRGTHYICFHIRELEISARKVGRAVDPAPVHQRNTRK